MPEYRTPYKDSFGVIQLTIYTAPHVCGGKCLYCFTDPGMPKSSLFHEDSARAQQFQWSPGEQLRAHFERFGLGQRGAKYGINILGGSFTAYEKGFLRDYVRDIYNFFNDRESSTLGDAKQAHKNAVKGRVCILSVQTRPDLVDGPYCGFLMDLGVTEVQLGVQSLRDNVLSVNRRLHSSLQVRNATRLLKEHGFSVVYHMMIGMVGSDRKVEVDDICETLWQDDLAPDYLKVYPCIAVRGAKHNVPVESWFRYGWKPLGDLDAEQMLGEIHAALPEYVFTIRIQRIVEEERVLHGPSKVISRDRFDSISRCVFHRSVARNPVPGLDVSKISYIVLRQGYGFYIEARYLEICLGHVRIEVVNRTGIIRDFRVYGKMCRIGVRGKRSADVIQGRGIGARLIQECESLAALRGCFRVKVSTPPGMIGYFDRLGYLTDRDGMGKVLGGNDGGAYGRALRESAR